MSTSLTYSASLNWNALPPLPDPVGFAGPFAGVSGGALIVAGGANFPTALPWEGGRKECHDRIFVLPEKNGKWMSGFQLPRPLGYGVSVSTEEGVICAGGSNADGHFSDVFLLRWTKGRIETQILPAMPGPCANGCGALLGKVLYVAGGTATLDATNALRNFWSLNLDERPLKWRELEPWPGPGRMLAVAGVDGSSFYLFSGVALSGDAKGKPVRRYLRDAYRYTPGQGWKQIAALPRAAVAAPSPAIASQGKLLIVSGDDGVLVDFEPKSQHPGFPKDILAYDPRLDQWSKAGDSPLSRATAPVVLWQGLAVIPNGEARPGRRTPEVWAGERHHD